MKSNIDTFQPKSVTWKNQEFSFLRKGKCGSFKEILSGEQRVAFLQSLEKRKCEEQIRTICGENNAMSVAIRSYLDHGKI
jgi:hypothetical protein